MEWSSEVGAADRIVARLHPFAADVGSFVPEGLEANARVLHPSGASTRAAGPGFAGLRSPGEAGAAVHPSVRLEELRPSPDLEPPLQGTLDRDELDALVEILSRHTTTPRACWFGLWGGLWWPQDGAWCVASEIDLPSTYLGGTRALVEEVLGDGRLEGVPAGLTDPVHG